MTLPALTLLAAMSGAAVPQPAPASLIVQTSDVDVDHNYGVSEGSLRLTIGSDGEITGYFRPVDTGRLIEVRGGLTGTKIYFYIGENRRIDGTFAGGKLDAYTLEGIDVHHFTGEVAQTERS